MNANEVVEAKSADESAAPRDSKSGKHSLSGLLIGVAIAFGLFAVGVIGVWAILWASVAFDDLADELTFVTQTILSLLVFLAVVAHGCIYWSQRQYMKRQWSEMREALDQNERINIEQRSEMQLQARIMINQAKTAADELHRSHRPWVGLAELPRIESQLTFDATGASLNVSYRLRNGSNNSPAIGSTVVQTVLISLKQAPDIEPLKRELRSLCEPQFIQDITKGSGILLLPNAEMDFPPGLPLTLNRDTLKQVEGSNITLFLLVCVPYRDEFGKVHSTSSAYRFISLDGERSFRPTGTVAGRFETFGLGHAD